MKIVRFAPIKNKVISLFLLLSIMLGCSVNDSSKTISPPIKSIEQSMYYIHTENDGREVLRELGNGFFPKVTKDIAPEFDNYYVEYNERGDTIEFHNYIWGDFSYKLTFEYDSCGLLTKSTYNSSKTHTLYELAYDYLYSKDNVLLEKRMYRKGNLATLYKYNQDGNLLEEIEFFDTNSGKRIIQSYEYDKAGKIIRWKVGNQVYEYEDEDGKIKSIFITDKRGNKNIFHSYKYDRSGNLFEDITYLSDQLSRENHIAFIDIYKDGELIQREHYSDTGLSSMTKYVNGKLTEWILFDESAENKHKLKYLYTYNKLGDIAEEKTVGADGDERLVSEYEYKYDRYGNWIERRFYDMRNYIQKRKITYY